MNNGKIFADAYREPVYGSDSSIAPVIQRVQKEDIRLPVFGLQKRSWLSGSYDRRREYRVC